MTKNQYDQADDGVRDDESTREFLQQLDSGVVGTAEKADFIRQFLMTSEQHALIGSCSTSVEAILEDRARMSDDYKRQLLDTWNARLGRDVFGF